MYSPLLLITGGKRIIKIIGKGSEANHRDENTTPKCHKKLELLFDAATYMHSRKTFG